MTSTKFIVMTSSAKMPRSVKSEYRNVAVVELEEGFEGVPSMISERAKGAKRIVKHFGACSVGKTERAAYQRAVAEAEEMATKLNTIAAA